MFTKKHINTLAAWIKWSQESGHPIDMTAANALISHLRESNINFDRVKFIEACGWDVGEFNNAMESNEGN